MLKKNILTILTLCFISTQTCFGIEDAYVKIDLKTAIKLSITKNLDYTAAKKEKESAEERIKAAGRFNNPSITNEINLGKAGAGNPDKLVISELIEIGKRGPRKAIAKSEALYTENEINHLKFRLKTEVRKSYINLLVAKIEYNNLLRHERLLNKWYETAKIEHTAGRLTDLEYLQTEVAYKEIIPSLNQARVLIETERETFNKIINSDDRVLYDTATEELPQNVDFLLLLVPEPTADIPSSEEVVNYALTHRFDIKSAKQKVDIAQKNLISVKRQRIPDIEASGGYLYTRRAMSDTGSLYNGAVIEASIVNIPLLYMYRPEIKTATIELEQAELAYKSTVNKAVKDVTSDYKKFITAKTNLNYYNDKLNKTPDQLLAIAEKIYMSKTKDITAMTVTEQSCREITLGYLAALEDYYDRWTELLEAVQDEDFLVDDGND